MRSPTRSQDKTQDHGKSKEIEPESGTFAPQPSQGDVAIAVMGVTGSGKSTFISLLAHDPVEIGHELESKTQEVQLFSFGYGSGQTGFIIDTPGFDDTNRSDAEILREIGFFLAQVYKKGLRLSGVVYLHRITDPRVGGSALKNLEIFKRLCGSPAFPLIRLVTTRWNEVPQQDDLKQEAERREIQLAQDDRFWGQFVRGHSKVIRHDSTEGSARNIVSDIIDAGHREVLAIQREMVDQDLPLEETTAGKFVSQEYERLQQKYEAELEELQREKMQAIIERDNDGALALEAQEKDFLAQKERGSHDQKQLQVSFKALQAEKIPELENRIVAHETKSEPPDAKTLQQIDLQILQQNVAELQEDRERDLQEKKREEKERKRKEKELLAEIERLKQERSKAPRELRHAQDSAIAQYEQSYHRIVQQGQHRSNKEPKEQRGMKTTTRNHETTLYVDPVLKFFRTYFTLG